MKLPRKNDRNMKSDGGANHMPESVGRREFKKGSKIAVVVH